LTVLGRTLNAFRNLRTKGEVKHLDLPDVPEVQAAVKAFIKNPESQPPLDNVLEIETYG